LGKVVKRAMPAVVSVITTDRSDPQAPPAAKGDPQKGVGAGFIVSPDGYILTCSHVIEDAIDVRVTLLSPEGFPEEWPAAVVGHDSQTDFALLKVDVPRRLPVLALGSASTVEVADWVIAIGSPFGLARSVSVGVVSFKGRTEVTPSGRHGIFEYLQTDASINPGNSGGPILDINGDVVAIANAVNVSGQGIGFAVPVDMAKAVLPQLKTFGGIQHGWLGMAVKDVTPEMAEALGGIRSYGGVFVSDVSKGGPADLAGVRVGDLVTHVRSLPIHRTTDIHWRVETANVGDEMELGLQREGKLLKVSVQLKAPPSSEDAAP
jgi:serine protease Do